MEVWRGNIAANADEEVPNLEGKHFQAKYPSESYIEFYAPNPELSVLIPPSTSFKFLSYVDITRIPLHFIAGGALEVRTNSTETEAWFETNLLTGFSLPSSADGSVSDTASHSPSDDYQESNIAILLGIEGPEAALAYPTGPQLTELLLYASASLSNDASTVTSHERGILTPPRSSSPDSGGAHVEAHPCPPLQGDTQVRWQATIRALPLSSHLSYHAPPTQPALPPSLSSSAGVRHIEGHFLPAPSPTNPRKRQKLDTLFSGAAAGRKRARKQGRGGLAGMMAGLESDVGSVSKSTSTSTGDSGTGWGNKEKGSESQVEMKIRKLPKPALEDERSRITDTSHSRTPSNASAAGPIHKTKRTALHRAASANDAVLPPRRLGSGGCDSPAPDIATEQLAPDSFQAKNKSTLSRIIMAGMRMHGLSQRKKSIPPTPVLGLTNGGSSSRPTTASEAPTTKDDRNNGNVEEKEREAEDEFKLIYHRTLQASSFALRREMGTKVIGQERVREVVDALLGMFCGDTILGTDSSGMGKE